MPRSGPSVVPELQIPLPGTTRLWGERPRRPKGIEALAASTKNREEEWAAWWMLSASKIKRGKVLSNIRLVNIPTGLFAVEFGGTCVWLTNWKEGGGQFQWGDGPSQGHGKCATHSGE